MIIRNYHNCDSHISWKSVHQFLDFLYIRKKMKERARNTFYVLSSHISLSMCHIMNTFKQSLLYFKHGNKGTAVFAFLPYLTLSSI